MKIGTPLSASATKVMLLGAGELGKEVIIALQRHIFGTRGIPRHDLPLSLLHPLKRVRERADFPRECCSWLANEKRSTAITPPIDVLQIFRQ